MRLKRFRSVSGRRGPDLTDPKRPIGVFLLVGTSGVGKTETALALAESLYGGERNLISINMSEYQEAHTVSSLKGSPPGYVGYGEGGVLTEAVRRKPYSVVLLDEVEKAHPDVMELFFQVFDKGILEDGEGREIDFKNCIILLTSNVGTDTIMKLCADPDTKPDPDGLVEAIKPELNKAFKPALLGRMVTVPFYPISDDILRLIIKLQLGKIETRIGDNHRCAIFLRRLAYRDGREALYGRRLRCEEYLQHPYRHAASGNERRSAFADGERRRNKEDPRQLRGRREFCLRFFVTGKQKPVVR